MIARKNGKPLLRFIETIEREHGIPHDELEAVAETYRPTLEAFGLLDDLLEYQEVLLFVWIWKLRKGGRACRLRTLRQ